MRIVFMAAAHFLSCVFVVRALSRVEERRWKPVFGAASGLPCFQRVYMLPRLDESDRNFAPILSIDAIFFKSDSYVFCRKGYGKVCKIF